MAAQAPSLETLVQKLLLTALTALRKGDFSVRLSVERTGIPGKIADAFNSTVEMARVVGSVAKGDLSQAVSLEGDGNPLQGEFLRTAKTVNAMVERLAANLTSQVRAIAEVATAVTKGDLTRTIKVEARGEVAALERKTRDQPEFKDFVRHIQSQGPRLSDLTSELLSLGRGVNKADFVLCTLQDQIRAEQQPRSWGHLRAAPAPRRRVGWARAARGSHLPMATRWNLRIAVWRPLPPTSFHLDNRP